MSAPPIAELLEVIQRLQPVRVETLQEHLDVSQQTLSRWLRAAGDAICRMGRTRGAQYARTRTVPGLGTRVPVHRVDEEGQILLLGTLHFLSDGGSWLEPVRGPGQRFEGRPPFAEEMRPQGYMGRGFLQRNEDLTLPSRMENWSDDQVFLALSRRGEDCTGNLILGEESLSRYLAMQFPLVERTRYPERARGYLAEGAGSSAGGEQPKFAAYTGDRHILVKFADASAGSAGQRWRDLLACEHLALKHVRSAGFEAAEAEWFDLGDYRFLEVTRFDRLGRAGRRSLLSLRAIDNEYVGLGTSWTQVALRLREQRRLSRDDVRRIIWLDTFGQLIGNIDRHLGNVSCFEESPGRFRLAPIYDMLPMVFAPDGAHLVERTFNPATPDANNLDVWGDAARHALAYWDTLVGCADLSEDFRRRCATCREAVAALIQRLPRMGATNRTGG
ncbi:type II toxin-antitoxin system HipA family toxin YjjJ [Pyxidicoccus parkwayensis]|uniref:Type II toxin-antitoxin system HipA family toxin YjjJ n=1 Tax=Pyxidicoccus parkwayensis TaxID=2813578 RepID=A0ABX7NQW9_9BACT|nr:type II toxin-antitoxin system HipA family toxin YjjJ [Pyxidicoccus parkwaysis]QSQ21267.1 type II toxin-antitoxin system HipA family toxin YjjJ [Pyxidicoccus parkwaysis]